jgi:glycogen synthase
LTFTDTSTATSFQLFPSIGSASPIDYQLYLDNDPITKGTPFLWQNINPGLNAKDLMIGGINESDVINKVSGTYSGTITVTISTPN